MKPDVVTVDRSTDFLYQERPRGAAAGPERNNGRCFLMPAFFGLPRPS